MACITRQRTCSRLVDKAADLAKDAGWGLIVAHAVHPGEAILGKPREAEAMEELFELAVQYGGEMAVLRDEYPMEALVNYALNHRVSLIVLGVSPATAEMSFADRMRQRLPHVHIICLDARIPAEQRADAQRLPELSFTAAG